MLYGGEIMKNFKMLFTLLLIFIGISSVYAFDNTIKVYDYAQVLTSDEEDKLKTEVNKYIDEYNMDMVLVTVKHHEKFNTKEYAMDFYDYNEFGIGDTNDGIIFVIDFTFGGLEHPDIYISTTGKAILMYDDYRIDTMLDNIADKKNDGYFMMFESFIKDSSIYAKAGIPDSNSRYEIDSNGNYVYKKSLPWVFIIIVSILVPTITIIVLVYKNKMVRKSVNANYYLKDGSLKIKSRNDMFVTTHTTSVRINDDSSSRGHSGGSSISRGSSGVSHGGGGRRL